MLLLLLLLVATGCVASKPPNFVILFVDDLGYNEINLKERAPESGGMYAVKNIRSVATELPCLPGQHGWVGLSPPPPHMWWAHHPRLLTALLSHRTCGGRITRAY